jgi:hypothetical protein
MQYKKNGGKKHGKTLTAEVIPVVAYDADTEAFIMRNGEYLGMVELRTKDHNVLDEETISMDNNMLNKLFRIYSDDLKLVSFNFPVDTHSQVSYLEKITEKTRNPVFVDQLKMKLYEEDYIAKNFTDREFVFLFYAPSREKYRENFLSLRSCLNRGTAPIYKKMDPEKMWSVLFRLLNMNSPLTSTLTSERYRGGIDYLAAKGKADEFDKNSTKAGAAAKIISRFTGAFTIGRKDSSNVYIDHRCIRELEPRGGITFAHEKYMSMGDGYAACLYVHKYSKNIYQGWLSRIMSIDDTVAILDISSRDPSDVKKNLNKSLEEQNARYKQAKNSAQRLDAQNRYQELETIYNELSMMDDTTKQIKARIYVYDRSLADLEKKVTTILKSLEGDSFRAAINLGEGRQDWQALILPTSIQNIGLYRRAGMGLLSSQLSLGNPFNYASFYDPAGTYYGTTVNGAGAVNLDLFQITDLRMSYNNVLVGKMGSGKSTLLKKILTERAIRGDYIRLFDPTGEFGPLIDYLGGSIISLDGSSGNIINPLQILRAADDAETSYNIHFSKMAAVYKFLQPEAIYQEVLMMEKMLRQLYIEHGLVSEDDKVADDITDRLPQDYPTWADYLYLTERQLESATGIDYDLLKNIWLVIDNIKSNYSNLMVGHTTIRDTHKEQIVCFDVSRLAEMKSAIFDAQLFVATSLCWDDCVTIGSAQKRRYDKGEITQEEAVKSLIIIDEAHRMVNAGKLAGIDRLSLMSREGRKYFVGLFLASQSIRDFVPDNATAEGTMEITRLFELSTYKWILQQDTSAKDRLKNIFSGQFSEYEIDSIPVLEKGQTILSISGDSNIMFNVEVSDDELSLFAGGA